MVGKKQTHTHFIQTVQDTKNSNNCVFCSCLLILGLMFCCLFMPAYISISLRLTQLVELSGTLVPMFFFLTNYKYIVFTALCVLRCKRMKSSTASLEQKKHKQNFLCVCNIIFQCAHRVKPLLGRDCFAPSQQFVGFYLQCSRGLGPSAKKEVAAENCREIFQESRGKSSCFFDCRLCEHFFSKIIVDNQK